MIKVVNMDKLKEMGFIRDGVDWVCYVMCDGDRKVGFRLYAGSQYIRHPKTAGINMGQIQKVYEWTQNGDIIWEEI